VSGKRGRPTIYDEKIAAEILHRMSEGETLTAICSEEGKPGRSTVCMWAINDNPPGFYDRYAKARELQALAIAEDALDISDDKSDDPASRRIRVDARKWFASKMNPAKFGDKSQVDLNAKVDFAPNPIGRRGDLEPSGEDS